MTAPGAPSLAGLYGADQRRPLYSRLPTLYFSTPPWVRALARWALGSRQGPREALVQTYLARLEGWPEGARRPVPLLLTHDVDTAPGYSNLPRLLEAEEQVGLRSLTLLVTHRYAWDAGTLRGFAARGHRFGVHDTTHDNTLAYLPAGEVKARIGRAKQALGALDCGAFRAPAFLRSRALYEGLADLVAFDLSTNDWALSWPHPGDGIGSPFPVRYGRMVCVPTTLPRDGEVYALGLDAARRLDLWRRKATLLHRVGAPAVLLTHPDRTFTDSAERIGVYGELLRWFRESRLFQIALPAECLEELARRATSDLAPAAPVGQRSQ